MLVRATSFNTAPPKGFSRLRSLLDRRTADVSVQNDVRSARKAMAEEQVIARGYERLADLRLSKGLSQLELANLVGTSQPRLSQWENAKDKPGYENIVALAAALEVDFNRLHKALAHA
jgi:DNA-binding transcriptional regulator YiaG